MERVEYRKCDCGCGYGFWGDCKIFEDPYFINLHTELPKDVTNIVSDYLEIPDSKININNDIIRLFSNKYDFNYFEDWYLYNEETFIELFDDTDHEKVSYDIYFNIYHNHVYPRLNSDK